MPKPVTIDIHVSFGRPCITGTGVPTAVLAGMFVGGDSIGEIAEDRRLARESVEAALRFELATPAKKRELADIKQEGIVGAHGRAWKMNPRTLNWGPC